MNDGKKPVLYGIQLPTPPTNHHLLAAQQEPYKNACLLTENICQFSGTGEWTISRKMTGQKEQDYLGKQEGIK